MSSIKYRQAVVEDAAEIHELLLRLAPEIPLLVDTLEREEALYALVRQCARGGESWVATGNDGRVLGVALAELNQRGRHYAENEILELRHAAALRDAGEGVIDGLLGKVMARMLPVRATVSPQNRSGLMAVLKRLGFRESAGAMAQTSLDWRPGKGF